MNAGANSRADVAGFVDESGIWSELKSAGADPGRAKEIIAKARERKGLEPEEIAVLLNCTDPETTERMFDAACRVKEEIYGKRLVLFAPLYVSNLCSNECLYCSFRAKNKEIHRRALTQDEVEEEVRHLVRQGHKRVLLVAGESHTRKHLEYVFESIATVYNTRDGNGEIRRVNVNIAPLSVDEFKELKACRIGTYQLFQETYHLPTYRTMHVKGPKADYGYRLGAPGRAMEAGIDDVGIGILFGLYDYRFEIMALMRHIRRLEAAYGVGPHTISVPRLEPADGSVIASDPPYPVDDRSFERVVALLRLAVPYTGIIMSTRERPRMRARTLELGVSQISAGSRTNPGGYGKGEPSGTQFHVGDMRSLDEVVRDITEMGFIPSFCTGCYRLGRTGGDFMDLAKPGVIKRFCLPNAIMTFGEYLEDYASLETKEAGEKAILEHLSQIPSEARRRETEDRLARIRAGERDVYF